MADDLNTPRISDWVDGGARNRVHPIFLGLRTAKRRWLKAGANPLLAVKSCIENNRWTDFLDRRACRAASKPKKSGRTPRNSESGEAFDRLNLNDGTACRFAANGSMKDILAAIHSASRGFASFGESPARDRERRLRKTGELAECRKADFADGPGGETGPPVEKAGFEFRDALGMPRAVACRRAAGATRSTDRCPAASPARPSSATATARAAAKAFKPTRRDGRNESADNVNSRAVV